MHSAVKKALEADSLKQTSETLAGILERLDRIEASLGADKGPHDHKCLDRIEASLDILVKRLDPPAAAEKKGR